MQNMAAGLDDCFDWKKNVSDYFSYYVYID